MEKMEEELADRAEDVQRLTKQLIDQEMSM